MFRVFSQHKSISIIGSALILLLTISFNVYYLTSPNVVSNNQSLTQQEVNSNLPGHIPNSNVSTTINTETGTRGYIPLVITVSVFIIGFAGLLIAIKIANKKQTKQDIQYREQLNAVALSFEAYAVAKGHYPKSATYSPEHYTGIHLGKEWLDYGFPSDDEMRQFSPNWPVVPTNSLDKILYYVRENGSRFDLFAHIKTLSKTEAKDYNAEFELPRAWGEFNYYIASKGIATTTINPSTPAAESAPASTIPSDVQTPVASSQNLDPLISAATTSEQVHVPITQPPPIIEPISPAQTVEPSTPSAVTSSPIQPIQDPLINQPQPDAQIADNSGSVSVLPKELTND